MGCPRLPSAMAARAGELGVRALWGYVTIAYANGYFSHR